MFLFKCTFGPGPRAPGPETQKSAGAGTYDGALIEALFWAPGPGPWLKNIFTLGKGTIMV